MRKEILLYGLLLSLCLCACSRNDALPDDTSSGVLRFDLPTTRAAIHNGAELSRAGNAFAVWGDYRLSTSAEAGRTDKLFSGDAVTYNGTGWNYEGEIRYWYPGYTYNFYAVYPSSEVQAGKVSYEGGTLSVSHFDATRSVDLMAAEHTGIVCTPDTPSRPVSFSFTHLMSQVRFEGKVDPAVHAVLGDVTVESAKLYGLYKAGSYSASGWIAGGEMTTSSDPFAHGGGGIVLTSDKTQSVFREDILPVPVRLTNEITLDITYHFARKPEESKNMRIHLPILSVGEWKPGKGYKYSFVVGDDEHIYFDKPGIVEWAEASGGIIVVE